MHGWGISGRNIVTLNGRLVPHLDNVTELNLLGEMFTGYINGDTLPTRAAGVSATQLNGDKVAWLSEGISALDIAVPLKAPEPINPIKGIVIDYLSLAYTPETAYQPTIFSNSLSAGIGLPFGFSLDIVSTANTITIVSDGAPVGTIEGAFSNSSTTLNLISAGQTAGTLNLTLPPSPLVLPNNTQDARRELEQFQKAFALTNGSTFALQGAAKAVTEMPLGKVLLDGIKFDVVSGIKGLEGLTKYPTLINTIDVTGGTQEALTLAISTTLVNPSNLNLSIGDSTFQLVKGDAVLGTTTLPNLDLMIGRNDVDATALFHPNTDPQGYETLNRFVSGLDTVLDINGFDGSSNIASLIPALEPIRLNATLPGLKQKLVQMANLTVLDSTGIVDDVANSIVGLANPFSSGLTITRIASNVTSHGINIASIGTPLTFPAAGKALSDSPPIPLTLNLYPPDIFGLLRALVVQSGQDPVQLDGIVQLGGYTLTPTTDANSANGNNPGRRGVIEEEEPVQRDDESASFVTEEDDEMARMLLSIGRNPGALASIEDEEPQYAKPATPEEHLNTARSIVEDGIVKGLLAKRANIYTGFDLPSYVDRAFKVATVNLDIVSDVTIGDYGTTLTFSQTDVPLGTDATLNKLLPVLAAPIVQKIVDGAVLALDRVTILDPQNESFNTALQGSITQAGPFDAVIQFTQGLTVDWQGQALGQIAFPNVSLAGDVGAQLDLTAQFAVASVDYLTTFTKYLLTEQSFIWNIHGTGLSVSALGIVVPNITISKDVMLTGFNGLKGDVIINSFDLPSNDPAGGIHLTLQTTVNNPSQVGVQLSTFGVNNKYNGTYIGPAASEAPFILQANAKTDLPLVGRLVHQDSDVGLAVLSDIFTRFVHDIDSTVNVNGNNAGPPDCVWLNEGIKVLSIDVSLPAQKFQVIKSISLNQLSLFFTTQSAWSPATSSNNTTSAFFIPFAFPIDIQQVGGDFVANYQNQDDAVLNIPLSPSTTDVAARILTLMFQNVPFEVYNDKHAGFSQFLADTTAQDSVTFNLNGKADTRANTAAGLISITQIPFSVDTTLAGLQNLNARPANVSDLDVFHGYSSYLQINVMTTLYNPSAITIGTGDVSFNLNFEDHLIGQAVIQNLVLVPGENTVPTQVKYMPKGGANVQAGQHLLENYVQSIVSNTIIQGTRDTTPIASLKQALSGITLTAAIPPLMQLLITGAALTIPKDIAQTSYASATFTLRNPFTASINLLQVKADASYQGIFLGEINENLRKNIITAPGHTTISSYELPFKFNLDPKNLIRFIEAAAAATNTDLGPLPPLFQQVLDSPSTQTTVSPYPDDSMPPCSSGQQFDVLGAILKTVAGLQTTLDIASTLKLDDYQTDLDFKQNPVPTKTDNSVLYLVGPVGAPIVQTLVSGAALSFSQANITGVTDSGFDVALQGSLTGTGPFDAYIEFPEPVVVNWMGKDIATISLPPICAFANEGAPNLMTSGHLTITNLGGFTDFATYILHNPSFTWTISTQHLRVRALGIAFSDVILQKDISFKAFNGLPGVTISNFNIPSDTSDALNIQTDSLIPSPATLGIELGTANFEIFFEGTDIGPIHASNLFLAPTAVTDAELMGQITRKSGKDLETTGKLFSQYLQGVNQTLQVQGVSVISPAQPNSPVNWLSAAFKTLNLQVILPGMKYQIIYSITLSDLTVNLIGDPADSYTVPSSNNQTIAVFSNPFGFSLQPIKAAPHILIRYQNADTATLDLPLADVQAGTSRGPTDFQNLQLMFRNQNLVAVDHGSFQSFFAQLTDQARGTFDLDGSTDVTARTVIGDIPIAGIPFNVTTSLSGINSFGRSTTISDLYVDSATPQYIRIPLKVTLNNPSNLTVNTKDISLPTRYQGYEAGRTIIPGLGLIPGDNLVDVEFHYMPADANNSVAQALLQKVSFTCS